MYIIDKPIELKRIGKLYSIKEIALIDGVYYVKTDRECLSVDEYMLRGLSISDRTKICKKAHRRLKDRYYIGEDLKLKKIEEFKIIREEDEYKEVEKPQIKGIDTSIFDNMSFKEMYVHILQTKEKRVYVYEILAKKFDEEYNTEEKQRYVFEKLNIYAYERFCEVYKSNQMNEILDEIWKRKTKEEMKNTIYNVDMDLYNTPFKDWSNKYLTELYECRKISNSEYYVARRMNEIVYIVCSSNLMHMKYKTFESCATIVDFLTYFRKEFKNINISKVLRLTENEILDLINEYFELQELLV